MMLDVQIIQAIFPNPMFLPIRIFYLLFRSLSATPPSSLFVYNIFQIRIKQTYAIPQPTTMQKYLNKTFIN